MLEEFSTQAQLARHIAETKNIPDTQYESDIDSVFHSFSHNRDDLSNGERDISPDNGEMAVDELVRRWDISLSDKEVDVLKRKNFKAVWNRYANANGHIDTSQAVDFMKDLVNDIE